MIIKINSNKPIYEQIVDSYVSFINSGVYKENDHVPSVRELAIEIGINPNTVARAYSILEEEGYIYSLNKKGYYVCKRKINENSDMKFIEIKDVISSYIKNGMKPEEIEKTVHEYISYLKGEKND